MAWTILIVSGLLECAWALGLKFTDGFTRPVPTMVTLVISLSSFALLSLAARDLPIGTAYAVWVGIGAVGTTLLGILVLNEPINVSRLACLALLLVAIIGLKFSSTAS